MKKNQTMQLKSEPLTAGTRAALDLVVVGVCDGALEHMLGHAAIAEHAAFLGQLAREERFVGSFGQRLTAVLPSERTAPSGRGSRSSRITRVSLVGLGAVKACTPERFVHLGGTAVRLAQSVSAGAVAVVPPQSLTAAMASDLAKGAHLGQYRFDAYRGARAQAKRAAQAPAQALHLLTLDGAASAEISQAIKVGSGMAMAVRLARDLVNCPPNDLYPESFARKIKATAAKVGVRCKVMDDKELRRRGMGMLLGVGMGSARPPRLVHLSYSSRSKSKSAPTLLVGKGITFDSGGLCIKGCDAMGTMKMDMGGAAAVFSTIIGAAALKLDVHVEGVLALAENMPSGHALRTGDVLTSAAGLTVEVNNTDAEGRLVLGDALHYGITTCAPKRVVDVATLTGACMVALGPNTTGLFANNDALATALLGAAERGGEHMWRMPLTEALGDQLRSDIADMRNTGDRLGGAITAALFLQRFVQDVPWAHLDIAGPAWANHETAVRHKGGTGAAVCSLMELLLQETSEPPQGAQRRQRSKRDH